MATVRTSTLYFGKNDDDIIEHIESLNESLSAYVRRLIREDIAKSGKTKKQSKNNRASKVSNNEESTNSNTNSSKDQYAMLETMIDEKLNKLFSADKLLALANSLNANANNMNAMYVEKTNNMSEIAIASNDDMNGMSVEKTNTNETENNETANNDIKEKIDTIITRFTVKPSDTPATSTSNANDDTEIDNYFSRYESSGAIISEDTDNNIIDDIMDDTSDVNNLIKDQL